MKRIIFPLFSLFFLSANAQNLVPNGSFENFSSCPPTSVACVGRIDLLNSWFIPVDGNSPDLYSTCHVPPFPGLNVDVPNNMYGTQNARTGSAYAGFYPRTEYIEVPLTSTLIAGENYDFEMYVNLADYAQETTDGIGVYFSNAITTAAAGWGNAQINNAAFNFITDTAGWTLISGTYTAAGGENFITIGNFFSNFYPVSNAGGSLANSYYYVDDVSLIHSVPLPIELTAFNVKESNGSAELNWTTTTEINNDFFTIEKSSDGVIFEPIATIAGAGNSTTELNYSAMDHDIHDERLYYRLRQTDFDGKSSLSDIKSIRFKSGSALSNDPYPNPSAEGIFYLQLKEDASFTVYDVTGKIIIERNVENDFHQKLDLSNMQNGIYMLVVSDGHQTQPFKLIKQ